MGEQPGNGGIGRRDLLKKSAVAGGIVWAAPTIFSSTAGAGLSSVGSCTDCPPDRLFGIKVEDHNEDHLEDLPVAGGPGNCLTATAAAPPECFEGYFDIEVTGNEDDGHVHTWTLQPSMELCQAAAKLGDGADVPEDVDSDGCIICPDTSDPADGESCGAGEAIHISVDTDGITTVVIDVKALSHSEILFCYRGSPLGCLESS